MTAWSSSPYPCHLHLPVELARIAMDSRYTTWQNCLHITLQPCYLNKERAKVSKQSAKQAAASKKR